MIEEPSQTDAAQELARLMGQLTQRCWCAFWLDGPTVTDTTEHGLWAFVIAERGGAWGGAEVSESEALELGRLSRSAGGWWWWDPDRDRVSDSDPKHDAGGLVFMSLDEWRARYRRDAEA